MSTLKALRASPAGSTTSGPAAWAVAVVLRASVVPATAIAAIRRMVRIYLSFVTSAVIPRKPYPSIG